MTLLLDTHTMVWMIYKPHKLSARLRALLADPANKLLVSICSLWELTIELAIGKMQIPGSDLTAFLRNLEEFGVGILPVTPEQLLALQQLPRHHRDPFDRMLMAQSIAESVALVTKDEDIQKYDLELIW